ncbi:MAG: outer membrane lipoprotein-sorting protein, partial [Deltaproteobacteria bacterium]|nr:outer membrane lipoprotein-sorting protein [Deltaproteobacteria bacterium]
MSAIGTEVLNRFGLTADPFSQVHDPHFLLRSKPLIRALESLHHFVGEGANLMVVVAEAGVGKTALIDAISREFKDGIRAAKISHPAGSWAEVSRQIGAQLRLPGGRLTPGAMAAEQGCAQTYRLIVNHAEELSDESVKHLGAYLDLEATPGKFVHRIQLILMVREQMKAPLLAWLERRAHPRVDLGPLDSDQTRRYVERRVQLAQAAQRQVFTDDALGRIARLANGNPGAVNRLCRAALEVAASRGRTDVDAETVGTAAQRSQSADSPAQVTTARASAPPTPPTTPPTTSPITRPTPAAAEAQAAPFFLDDVASEGPAQPRVEILESDMSESRDRSQTVWVTICALLLGVIAGGVGFLYFSEPPPVPEPVTKIVEVPVPVEVVVEVEKIVEVPVEVVKIVEVKVPAKVKPRPPKPQPVKVAKVAPPPAKVAPAPVVIPRKPGLGPIPPAAEVLDRAFAKSRPGDHTRMVKILEHGDEGAKLMQTLKLARIKQQSRTLTVGVLTGDVSSDSHEVESRFLSIETGGPEDERFGYRPARGEVEELKGGGKTDPFHGSSFQYDDFRVRTSAQFLIYGIERSRVEDEYFYLVSVKPRYRAKYEKVEYVINAMDSALVEVHFFRGLGLRPYRILQYPRAYMEEIGEALVPMRIISRDFENSRIDEAR